MTIVLPNFVIRHAVEKETNPTRAMEYTHYSCMHGLPGQCALQQLASRPDLQAWDNNAYGAMSMRRIYGTIVLEHLLDGCW